MQTIQASWEDEENNRIVAMSVQYAIDSGEVKLQDVTPTSVTFNAQQRTIRVHTAAGGRLLRKQWRATGGVEHLEHQLTQSLLAGAQ